MKKIIFIFIFILILIVLISGCTSFNSYDSCVDDCLKIQYSKNCNDITSTSTPFNIVINKIDIDCRDKFLEMCWDKCLGAMNTK